MHTAVIGLGSNQGNSRRILARSWQALGAIPEIALRTISAPYHTAPVGMASENWFINAAGLLETSLPPESLLRHLLATEHRFGRIRTPDRKGYQDRTLDLDLLLFNHLVLETADLILPHPRMQDRLFVLAPLAEIAPEYYHPVLNKSIRDLLLELAANGPRGIVRRANWQEQDWATC